MVFSSPIVFLGMVPMSVINLSSIASGVMSRVAAVVTAGVCLEFNDGSIDSFAEMAANDGAVIRMSALRVVDVVT